MSAGSIFVATKLRMQASVLTWQWLSPVFWCYTVQANHAWFMQVVIQAPVSWPLPRWQETGPHRPRETTAKHPARGRGKSSREDQGASSVQVGSQISKLVCAVLRQRSEAMEEKSYILYSNLHTHALYYLLSITNCADLTQSKAVQGYLRSMPTHRGELLAHSFRLHTFYNSK